MLLHVTCELKERHSGVNFCCCFIGVCAILHCLHEPVDFSLANAGFPGGFLLPRLLHGECVYYVTLMNHLVDYGNMKIVLFFCS